MSDAVKNKTSNNYLDALLAESTDTNNVAINASRQQLHYRLEQDEKLQKLKSRTEDLKGLFTSILPRSKHIEPRMSLEYHKTKLLIIMVFIIVVGLLILTIPKPWNQ